MVGLLVDLQNHLFLPPGPVTLPLSQSQLRRNRIKGSTSRVASSLSVSLFRLSLSSSLFLSLPPFLLSPNGWRRGASFLAISIASPLALLPTLFVISSSLATPRRCSTAPYNMSILPLGTDGRGRWIGRITTRGRRITYSSNTLLNCYKCLKLHTHRLYRLLYKYRKRLPCDNYAMQRRFSSLYAPAADCYLSRKNLSASLSPLLISI